MPDGTTRNGQPASSWPVAVLGLGRMGSGLAARLLDGGRPVVVWNRDPAKAEPHVARGAIRAASPAAAAAEAGTVLVSLADDAAVAEVLTGPDGPTPGPDGPVVVDCSTVSPDTSRALAVAFPARFAAVPILGAPQAVANGTATYLVGASAQLRERLVAVLDALSDRRAVCGDDPAAATTVKLVCNYLLLGGLTVLGEAVAMAQASGIDSGWLQDFLGGGALLAPALHNRLADVVDGAHDGWFAARLGAKDVRLFARTADEVGVDAALARGVIDRYEAACELGWGEADIAAIVEVARRRAR